MPSLAEDLLLLLLDDEDGRSVVDSTRRDHAVAGAVLVDLARTGCVTPAEAGDDAKEDYGVVRDTAPTGDAVLDAAIAKLAEKPVKMEKAVGLLAKDSAKGVLAQLVDRGLVREEETKVLGLFRQKSWPAEDVEYEAGIRRDIEAALFGGARPDERTGCLITLLHACGAIAKVIDGDKATVMQRAKEIAEGDWASTAVRKAIDNANLMVITVFVAGAS
jgi:hypothetical protein